MAIINIAVTTASRRACVLSVISAKLFVKIPAINSKAKTETMAISDSRKALFLISPISGLVVGVVVIFFDRPATANKNRAKFII